MAEQIISPGVFQNENVPITLEAAAAPIGAAILGPTVKGQVGIPVTVSSYSEFLQKFGGSFVSGGIENTYTTALSAQNYFRQGGSNLLVTRVADSEVAYTASIRNKHFWFIRITCSYHYRYLFLSKNNFSRS